MNILLIADPHLPVTLDSYGGAKRIVALYAEESSRLGHRVDLLAGPGSEYLGAGYTYTMHLESVSEPRLSQDTLPTAECVGSS